MAESREQMESTELFEDDKESKKYDQNQNELKTEEETKSLAPLAQSEDTSSASPRGSPKGIRIRTVLPKKSLSSSPTKLSPNDQGFVLCRICHGGEFSCPFSAKSGEPLISPCHCRGTVGLYHRSCLERWLSTSNTEQCEICKFKYLIERHPQSFLTFVRNPGGKVERRNLAGDVFCWCFLTPLAVASAWLCIQGAVHYAVMGKTTVEVPGLVTLAVFLLFTYLVWFSVTIRYHWRVFEEWRKRNMVVKMMNLNNLEEASLSLEETSSSSQRPLTSNVSRQHELENMSVQSTSTPSATGTTLTIHFSYPAPVALYYDHALA